MLGKGTLYTLTDGDLHSINELLRTRNLPSVRNVQAREHFRVIFNRKTYCTRYYTCMKKWDNSTICFMENPPCFLLKYGVIERLIVVDNAYHLAVVTILNIIKRGLPCPDTAITPQTADILFAEYLQFNESCKSVIFVDQFSTICCNLSHCGLDLLTWFLNDIELD